MIFDVDAMKQTMLEFELDLEKMPLGKISKKQLEEAYSVLNKLDHLISEGADRSAFIGASNKFFSLVPHSFGMRAAPIIDNVEAIKSKREMIDSLLEIEIAYSMLKDDSKENVNPVDSHYEKLKTEIHPLEKDSEEFKIIQKYVENTHAATHDQYKLEIDEVFKVSRQGEHRRYKPFKKLHNRQLLWHGSRVTNYAGILSHGLKIAPPEAPVTGYMFGKGIYFADMVSKSANYCATTPKNNIGLMLLSEVALGDMHELTKATFVKSLPEGKFSVKGIGKTHPHPDEHHKLDTGVVVPCGKPAINDKVRSELLYNEYIVYDVAQVHIQYLLKLKFNYKRN
jgi:poly [ADP-ribose] polymerase